ncbi:MAG: hypothetical protein KBS70_00405 [Bacteroidales bacterium]|nr:hypothetical protein [Candidatus Colicola equi]
MRVRYKERKPDGSVINMAEHYHSFFFAKLRVWQLSRHSRFFDWYIEL